MLQFTDDSSWVRCRKFCIGAFLTTSYGSYHGDFRILEAMTEAFLVQDLNRKHYPPSLDDPVWRLEMVDKDGDLHRKLMSNNVATVQELLRMQNVLRDQLRAVSCLIILLLHLWRNKPIMIALFLYPRSRSWATPRQTERGA